MLATEIARPRTRPPPTPQPSAMPKPMPSSVATSVWTSAPGIAMRRTVIRSLIENSMPTPNISRMIPISASSVAIARSAISPGVNGPMTTPATMYPTIEGSPRRLRQQAADERGDETDGDRGDENGLVVHGSSRCRG